MTSYGLTITDAACVFDDPCQGPDEKFLPYCRGCNGTGTRTVDTGRDATPLAEAVKAFMAATNSHKHFVAQDAIIGAALALFDGLFPKEDPNG